MGVDTIATYSKSSKTAGHRQQRVELTLRTASDINSYVWVQQGVTAQAQTGPWYILE